MLGGVAEGAATVLVARVTEPALGTIREEVIQSALELPVSRIEEAGQGDLLSRVGDDIALVSRAVSQVVPTLVYSLVNILAGVTGIVLLDWRLALLGLIAGPFYLQSLRWYLPKSSPFYTRERVAQGERSEVLMSGIYGARTLRAYPSGRRAPRAHRPAQCRRAGHLDRPVPADRTVLRPHQPRRVRRHGRRAVVGLRVRTQ